MEGVTMDTRKWLVNWFDANSSVSRDVIEDQTDADYLESEWIDSMAFISLISAIEEEYEIEFKNDEFQDRSFATIDGLSEIIAEKSAVEE